MLLTPRYEGPDLLRIDPTACPEPSVLLLRQRRRLADLLADLDGDAWAAPSRCDAWSVREVVAHLIDTDRFWTFSISAARAGEPSRFLTTFDPVATPVQLVAAMDGVGPETILATFREGIDALGGALEGLDADGWELPGEAPPGHVPLRAVALHALWDGWIHERDIAVPLGIDPVDEPDEVAACLLYAAGLGPAFLAAAGSARPATLAVAPKDGDAVRVGLGATVMVAGDATTGADDADLVLRGSSLELIDALSFRGPLPHPVPDEDRWILTGLGTVFDVEDAADPSPF